MAKEDKNENQAPEQSVQQPEPPKVKKKGLSLPLIIGISLAALLILIGGTLGAVYLMVNNMMQHTNTEQTSNGHNEDEKAHKENSDEEDHNVNDKYEYLKNIVENQTKNLRYMELGEIITNPKNSDKFVVVDIGVEFVAYDETGEVIPVAEGGEGGEGEGSHFFEKRDMDKIREIVNKFIWSHTVEELNGQRGEMAGMLKEDFEEIYKENGGVIKDVIVLRFIVQ